MEEWENHVHLTTGLCFEMYFNKFNEKVKFKVIGKDSFGTIKAKRCDTKNHFEFNFYSLLKIEYFTLKEIECDNC